MRLLEVREGALELQWTWLPYWIACQPGVRAAVERRLQEVAAAATTDAGPDLEALSAVAVAELKQMFPVAAAVIDAIAAAPC